MIDGSFVRVEGDMVATVENPGRGLFDACCLLITVLTIVLFGLTMLYSTSSGVAGAEFFKKQLYWFLMGIMVIFGVNVLGYRVLSSWRWALLGFCIFLLVVALFCPAVKGAHRWIPLGKLGNIQPSEFTKFVLVLFLAKYAADNLRFLDRIFSWRGLLPIGLICALMLGLIFAGKDWGTTFLGGVSVLVVLFVAGVKARYILFPLLGAFPLYLYLRFHDAERYSRLTGFLDPEKYQECDGYQLWNSLLAIGSGFWTGIGFTESRMKAKYLPESHTDFILSIVAEELGFIAILVVLLMYVVFIAFGIRISTRAVTRQGALLGCGVTTLIGIQAFINIGVVSGALPTKGMPAPFISYGGSNLLACMFGTALLVNVALESAGIDVRARIPFLKRWSRSG